MCIVIIYAFVTVRQAATQHVQAVVSLLLVEIHVGRIVELIVKELLALKAVQQTVMQLDAPMRVIWIVLLDASLVATTLVKAAAIVDVLTLLVQEQMQEVTNDKQSKKLLRI